jgi:hypothetical protein
MTNNFTYYFITYGCKGEQRIFCIVPLAKLKQQTTTENIITKRIQKMKI